jgi:hypothetical protein
MIVVSTVTLYSTVQYDGRLLMRDEMFGCALSLSLSLLFCWLMRDLGEMRSTTRD